MQEVDPALRAQAFQLELPPEGEVPDSIGYPPGPVRVRLGLLALAEQEVDLGPGAEDRARL